MLVLSIHKSISQDNEDTSTITTTTTTTNAMTLDTSSIIPIIDDYKKMNPTSSSSNVFLSIHYYENHKYIYILLQYIVRIYSEFIIDCAVFDESLYLLQGLQPICDYVCDLYTTYKDTNHTTDILLLQFIMMIRRLLLACIGYILSTRSDTITTTFSTNNKKEKELWNQHIIIPLSTLFSQSSLWIDFNFTYEDTNKVIYILQKFGILSFIDSYDKSSRDKITFIIPDSSISIHLEWPFPTNVSMRKAFQRIGPQYPFTSLFSKQCPRYDTSSSTISTILIKDTTNSVVTPLLNYLYDDIIRVVFSFLGYKLLVRATSVCKVWYRIGNEDIFWKPMYLKRFQAIQVETVVKEMNLPQGVKSAYLESNYSYQQQNWRRLFDWKWKMEKFLHHQHRIKYKSTSHKSRPRTCDFVGCQQVLYGDQSVRQHTNKHLSQVKKDIHLFEKRNLKRKP